MNDNQTKPDAMVPVAYRVRDPNNSMRSAIWEPITLELGRVYLERKETALASDSQHQEAVHYRGLEIEPLYVEQPPAVGGEVSILVGPDESVCWTQDSKPKNDRKQVVLIEYKDFLRLQEQSLHSPELIYQTRWNGVCGVEEWKTVSCDKYQRSDGALFDRRVTSAHVAPLLAEIAQLKTLLKEYMNAEAEKGIELVGMRARADKQTARIAELEAGQGEAVAWEMVAVGEDGEVYRRGHSKSQSTDKDALHAWGQGVIDRFKIEHRPLYRQSQPATAKVERHTMHSVMTAMHSVKTLPILTSNQYAALAAKLNGGA